jgi:hypothetical protein
MDALPVVLLDVRCEDHSHISAPLTHREARHECHAEPLFGGGQGLILATLPGRKPVACHTRSGHSSLQRTGQKQAKRNPGRREYRRTRVLF